MSTRTALVNLLLVVIFLLPVHRSHARKKDMNDPPVPVEQSPRSPTSAPAAGATLLAEYTFDSGGLPDAQGWSEVDLTHQESFFHIDDYMSISGSQSLWCGGNGQQSPYPGWDSPPGYGNEWIQYFGGTLTSLSGDVTISFDIRYDMEDGFDFLYGSIPDTWFTGYSGDMVNTFPGVNGLGAGSTRPVSLF